MARKVRHRRSVVGITRSAQSADAPAVPHAGNAAEKRLAARMIPRFIHKFPHQVDAAASALLQLYNGSSSGEPESEVLACTTRLDALRGLSEVVSAAALLGDKAVKPVLRVVEFLIRWARWWGEVVVTGARRSVGGGLG